MMESGGWSLAECFERQTPFTDAVFESQDAKEGAQAFSEKRQPVWTGR
jgi:enoyl-CoA hydratase